jgi:DnaK suppressor protein
VDIEHARALLARERERVERALAGLGPAEEEGDTDVFEAADVAPDMIENELDEAVAGTLRDELAAIERAEQRLADGSYGVSVESGEPIPDARLEAVPWAERTTEEQSRYEQSG